MTTTQNYNASHLAYFAKIRKKLHQIPEIGLKEYKTAQLIREELTKMGYTYESVIETGTIVFINFQKNSSIAFRADIDGLPLNEETNSNYCSKHQGMMHACGHDVHTANLLTFAKFLSESKQQYQKNIVLIFQPAEENAGGAHKILETKILDKYNITEFHGFHIFPNFESNTIGYCKGPFLAQNAEFNVQVTGKSSHAASPELGVDAILAASNFVLSTKNIIATKINPFETNLIAIGTFKAGQARNVVAQTATIEGTIRSFSTKQFDLIKTNLVNILKGIDIMYGTKSKIIFQNGYKVVNNNEKLVDQYVKNLNLPMKPINQFLFAEDFSFYQAFKKGVFWAVGIGENYPLHSSKLIFEIEKCSNALELFIQISNYHLEN